MLAPLIALALLAAPGQQTGQGSQQQPGSGGNCLPYPNYRIETDTDFPLEMVPQVGHVEEIYDIAFSPDAELLITGGRDHTLRLWALDTGQLLRTVAARYEIRRVAFTADGKTMVAGDARGYLWAWDTASGKRLLKADPRRCGSITDLEVIGSRWALISCNEPEVKLVDLETGALTRTFPHLDKPRHGRFPKGQVRINSTTLGVSKDGKQMVVGYEKGGLKAWAIGTGKMSWERQAHRADVAAVEILPGGRVLSATEDEMRFWRLAGGKPAGRTLMRDYSERLTAFADGSYLLAAAGARRGKAVLKLLNPKNGRSKITLDDKAFHNGAVAVSRDGRMVASATENDDVLLVDLKKREIIRTLRGADALVWDLVLSPTDSPTTAATAVGDGLVVIWNLDELAVENSFSPGYAAPMLLDYSPDGNTLLAGGRHGPTPTLWDVRRGTLLHRVPGRSVANEGLLFSPDDRHLVVTSNRGWVDLIDRTKKTLVRTLETQRVDALAFSADGRTLWVAVDFDLQKWDPITGKELGRFKLKTNGVDQIVPLPDGFRVGLAQGGGPTLWDTRSGTLLRTFGRSGQIYDSLAISPDGCHLAGVGTPSTLDIWNIETGASVASFPSHTNDTRRVIFLPNGRHLLTASIDGTMRVWDVWSGYSVSMIAREGEWIIYTEDGYFDASRRGGQLVAAVNGLDGYRIDQLSLRNNRPDLILSRLKLGSDDLIQHFNSLYRRRLEKVGIAEVDLRTRLENAPVATIESFKQKGKQVTVRARLTDATVGLARYNIWVNDVPLFGATGHRAAGRSQTVTERVELTTGRNEIEISAVNRAGIESHRPYRFADYSEKPKGDLYFLGFGVSSYRDRALDLSYAHKDAQDLAALFAATKGYGRVRTKLFLNDQVTRGAIPAAAKFLAGSRVDDTVVMFAAGHGLYDESAEPRYYYVTHEADLADLANTAVEFEKLEGLLEGIAARRKLFLMDTCQSGELVGAFGGAGRVGPGGRGLRRRGAGIARAAGFEARPKRSFLLRRDRHIHNDLSRRTGTIVLSSSRGFEWSYERDDLQNGVFTEEVITALSSARADRDGDERVSIDELRDYVMAAVPKATDDQQHPVVDRDNLEQRFSFPLVPPERVPR